MQLNRASQIHMPCWAANLSTTRTHFRVPRRFAKVVYHSAYRRQASTSIAVLYFRSSPPFAASWSGRGAASLCILDPWLPKHQDSDWPDQLPSLHNNFQSESKPSPLHARSHSKLGAGLPRALLERRYDRSSHQFQAFVRSLGSRFNRS